MNKLYCKQNNDICWMVLSMGTLKHNFVTKRDEITVTGKNLLHVCVHLYI